MDAFAIKDSTNVQQVNVKDNLMLLQKRNKEQTSSCPVRTQLQFNNIDDYIHFYIKFIIFCKLYINRLHYF